MKKRVVVFGSGLVLGLAVVVACSGDEESKPTDTPAAMDACVAPADDAGAAKDAAAGAVNGGKVMVVGGAVADTSPIWTRLVAEGGGPAGVHFLVVTAATESVASNFAYYKDILNRLHGVSFDQIRQLRISDMDDPDTQFVDESEWKNNGDADAETASVRDWATVVWFAGGDQAHIMSTFVKPDGSDRAVTKAMREKLAAGKLIIAGTSAGAAVLSNPMIGEGDPFKSWMFSPLYRKFYPADGEEDGGTFNPDNAVLLNLGLGFLGGKYHVLTDTHWFQRARFARTIRALDFASSAASAQPGLPTGLDPLMKVGLGVGENTGLLVDLSTGLGEVVGDVDQSWVGVVNIVEATTSGMANPYSGQKVRVGFLGVRDRFALPTTENPNGTFLPEASKTRYQACNGGVGTPPAITGDMFVSGAYVDVLQRLLDGKRAAANGPCQADALGVKLLATVPDGQPFQVRGFFFRFSADDKTREFYSKSWGWEVENALMRFGTGTGSFTPPF